MTNDDAIIGLVFDLKRSCLHDGPGIRTTVFLKGCPLACLWCHNPESQGFSKEIRFKIETCVACGACVDACPNGCQLLQDGQRIYDRTDCVACGNCVESCEYGGLSVIGKEWTVEQVMAEVRKDRKFYANSGGGLTLSGGEPLAQPEFSLELLQAARSEGIHTCVETAGHVAPRTIKEAAEVTDLFLYDLKETDPVRHIEYTGKDNVMILQNLKALDSMGAKIILRCPVIPGLNDRPDHFARISEIAESLNILQELHLMPYHPFASFKSTEIGKDYALDGIYAPDDQQKKAWSEALQVSCPVNF